jgi:hypothetical protein
LLNRKTNPQFSKVWPRDFVCPSWNKPWKATKACPCYTTSVSYPRVDGIRNVIRLLGVTNEKIRRLEAEDLVDERFVRKLEKEGRF